MPQNLPQQILQRIVRLLADGTSQQEVARMLGVSQGCIRKILRCNRENGRPHQRKRGGWMKISTPGEDRQLRQMVRTNRFMSAPRLQMQMIRRFGRRMSVRTIRVLVSLWSRRVGPQTMETMYHQWRARFSLYHSDGRVRVRRRQGERLIDACGQPKDGNHGLSVMVWGAIHQGGGGAGRGGWCHKPASVHPDPAE